MALCRSACVAFVDLWRSSCLDWHCRSDHVCHYLSWHWRPSCSFQREVSSLEDRSAPHRGCRSSAIRAGLGSGRTSQFNDFAASCGGAIVGVLAGGLAITALDTWMMRSNRVRSIGDPIPPHISRYAGARRLSPMDMIRQGWAMRLFRASQRWSSMLAPNRKTRLPSSLSRMMGRRVAFG